MQPRLVVDEIPRGVLFACVYRFEGRVQRWASHDFAEVQRQARLIQEAGAVDLVFSVEFQ
jgi:hypothetical protein